MSTQDKERIQQAIIEACGKGKEMSYAKLAKLAKVNPSFVTHIVNGKWDNYSNGSSIKVAVFRSLAIALGLDVNTVATENHQLVVEALLTAKLNKEALIIDGAPGSGKSHAVAHFQRMYPKQTYVVKCSALMTVKEFIREVCRACDVNDAGSRSTLVQSVVEKLATEDAPLIIIDEAENLKDIGYSAIKDLYDGLERQCGIVLVGANSFYTTLQQKASRGEVSTRPSVFPQLFRRFRANPVHLERLRLEDVLVVVEHYQLGDAREARSLYAQVHDYGDLFATVRRSLADANLQTAA